VPDQPAHDPATSLPSYFGAVSLRNDERTVTTWVDVRDDLCNDRGSLRIGAVAYAVDIATGLTMGIAVVDRDLWVVTTDLDVHLTAPVTEGPLRVDADLVRAGATTAVATFTLHDEGADRAVGGGTATGRPFPFEFDRSLVEVPIGQLRRFDDGVAPSPRDRLATHLGFRAGEDGSVEVELEDWLRNPWGILHGGVTACLVDVAAEVAASAALGHPVRVTSELVRYLAPGKVGPVRAVPSVLATDDGRALVEVRVVDEGSDGRLVAVATLTAG
jgi:uncharacterized protein (TIGR00369 family)